MHEFIQNIILFWLAVGIWEFLKLFIHQHLKIKNGKYFVKRKYKFKYVEITQDELVNILGETGD